jgi:hypothetical protein
MKGQTTYAYDEKGNLAKETQDNADGSKDNATYTYIYDALGNWIKQTKDEQSDNPGMTRSDQVVLIRTITYYP